MEKKLFVCNTVYQLFVALWLKENKFKNSHVDIIISDHMNNSKELFNNVKKYADFDKNYWIESKNYSYFLENTRKFENIISDISPKYVLKKPVVRNYPMVRALYGRCENKVAVNQTSSHSMARRKKKRFGIFTKSEE